MSARRYVVAGQLEDGHVSLLLVADDEEHARELGEKGGLTGITVTGANRAMAREQRVYAPTRRRPRRMDVVRSRS